MYDLSRSSSGNGSAGSSPTNPSDTNGSPPTPCYEIGPGVHGGTIKSIVWATDLNIVVTAADDKMVRWWDLRARAAVGEYAVEGAIGSCELGGLGLDGASAGVLSVAAGKTVYFFDGVQPAQLIKTVATPSEVASVALHGEQRKFVTGSSKDTWVHVWDFDEGTELGKLASLTIL